MIHDTAGDRQKTGLLTSFRCVIGGPDVIIRSHGDLGGGRRLICLGTGGGQALRLQVVERDFIILSEQDYRQLVTRIAAGDSVAEQRLVEQFSRGLMVMLRQRTSDWDLAADIHQDAFIVVIKRLRQKGLQNPDGLKSFLRQTAINLLLGDRRKHSRRQTSTDSELIARVASESIGPVQSIERDQLAQLVRDLIAELTVPRDRQLLRRYYLAEESKQAICADLELDPGHFDGVIYRARQRLKASLEEYTATMNPKASRELP